MASLRVARDGEILRLTLARPEKRNAFGAELIRELHDAFADVGDARAVVLSGEGPSFSAGADIEWMRAAVDLSFEENVADAHLLRRLLLAIHECPAPVVAGVHGYALGGAVGLVCCADIAIAAEGAVFAFPETKLGLVPAVISPFVLARIGTGQSRRYFLTGERFGAETALRIGLVHEVSADLDRAVERALGELRWAGPEAVRAAKRLVLDGPLGDETSTRIAERRVSAEGQAGVRAFLEKRPPPWRSESSS